MDCFDHSGVAAVTICRSCGKGLCHPCAVQCGRGFSCASPECRTFIASSAEVAEHALLQARERARFGGVRGAKRVAYIQAALYASMGAVYACLSWNLPPLRPFVWLAVPLVIYAVFLFQRAFRYGVRDSRGQPR